MKKSKFLFTAIIILMSSFLLTSCSKDKRVERALYKKDGVWNITSVTWTKVIQDISGQSVTQGITANAGTFSFNKDGSGSYNFTINSDTYSQTFTWTVSNEDISITKVSQTVDFSGNFDQLAVAISGTQSSKSKIALDGSETHQYSSGNVTQKVMTGTFSLERK